MRAIEYLSVDQVIALHRRAIALYGGLDGIRSEHQLASAVFQPQASAFGEDA
jgi:prophage maintenance system killer protein